MKLQSTIKIENIYQMHNTKSCQNTLQKNDYNNTSQTRKIKKIIIKKRSIPIMANTSDATGTIQFDPDFYQQNKNIIDTFVQDVMKKDNLIDEYGITISNQDEELLDFEGSGRWTLDNNLDALLVPRNLDTDNVTKKAFFDFFKILQKQPKPMIKVDYTEYECGCEILADTTAKIFALNPTIPAKKGISKTKYFESKITNSSAYDYNDYNKINLDFEEGYFLDNPTQKQKFIQVEFEPWYNGQEAAYKKANPKKDLIKKILNTLKTDTDYGNAICQWRLDDDPDELFKELSA